MKIYKPDRGKRQSTLARFETWAATNKVELLKIPEESRPEDTGLQSHISGYR